MKRLNFVCLLSDAYGSFGGISQFNRNFLEALSRCAYVNHVAVFPRVISNKEDNDTIPENVTFVRQASRGKIAFLRCIIMHFLHAPRPDAVVCGHINLLPIAYVYAKMIRRRLILIVHGIDAWTPTSRRITNMLVSKVDLLVSVSVFTALRLAKWSHLRQENVFVLPNCVDLERFVPSRRTRSVRQRFGWSDRHRILMTMGRLAGAERYKGFDEVIEVLPDLLLQDPEIRYLIVGNGIDRARLVQKVLASGLEEAVAFAGQIADDERTAFYNAADLYVMPSRGEGFGIVLLEAAACGLPIVGSAADGSAEALLHGKLGRLVDPDDREALKAAILDQLPRNSEPTRSRLEAISYFSQKAYRERVEDLIMRLAHEGQPSAEVKSPSDPNAQTSALS